MLLLKQNTIKKKQVNKLLELEPKLNLRTNKKYKIEAIYNSKAYIKKVADQLLRLYYLISGKSNLKLKNS